MTPSSTLPLSPEQAQANQRLLEAVQATGLDAPARVAQALAQGASPNASDRHKSALHWAAFQGQEAILNQLLDAGADPLRLNNNGESPLHEVAVYGPAYQGDDAPHRAQRMAQRLLDAGADPRQLSNPNPLSRQGQASAAHALADTAAGALALVAILRAAPDLVHAVDQRGQTPLMRAVQERRPPAVEVLLAAGADPLILTPSGDSPMDLAKRVMPAMVERFNLELVNRERAALLPLADLEVASMTPSRRKTRL